MNQDFAINAYHKVFLFNFSFMKATSHDNDKYCSLMYICKVKKETEKVKMKKMGDHYEPFDLFHFIINVNIYKVSFTVKVCSYYI